MNGKRESEHPVAWAWISLLLVVALTSWAAWTFQQPISFHNGRGWDGVDYTRVAEQIARGQRAQAEAPFVYRIGAPALVAWLSPADPLQGFCLLNGVAAALAPLLLFAWLGLHGLRPAIRLLLAGLFATQWHAPLRLTPFYPAHVDPLMWVFWLGGLLLLEWSRARRDAPSSARCCAGGSGLLIPWCLWIIVAMPVREALLLPALALPFVVNPLLLKREPWHIWYAFAADRLKGRAGLLVPALLGLAIFLLIHSWALATNSYGFIKSALLWCWLKSVPHYLHGVFQALGPGILVLLLLGRSLAWDFLKERQDLLFITAAVLALAWLGGSDTERLVYWGAPIFYLLAGPSLKALLSLQRRFTLPLLLFLGAAQLISQRILWTIPDHPGSEHLVWPLLTPLSSTGRYLDLWSYHGSPQVLVLSFIQYLLVIGLGWWWGERILRRS